MVINLDEIKKIARFQIFVLTSSSISLPGLKKLSGESTCLFVYTLVCWLLRGS